METSEISLKLAEMILQAKQTDLTADLIKIGIPSIVALIGTISTIIIGLKAHQKDLVIAQLNAEKENDKKNSRLKEELIKEISSGVADTHATAIRYASLFASKIDLLSTGHPFPAMPDLRERHSDLLKKLHDIYEIESKVLLLGQPKVTEAFRDFNCSLSGLCSNYNPHDSAEYDKFSRDTFSIGQKKEALYTELSTIYFR